MTPERKREVLRDVAEGRYRRHKFGGLFRYDGKVWANVTDTSEVEELENDGLVQFKGELTTRGWNVCTKQV